MEQSPSAAGMKGSPQQAPGVTWICGSDTLTSYSAGISQRLACPCTRSG